MPKGLLGKKVGMTQYFTDTGDAIAVTCIEAGPCYALQLKRKDNDGYDSVQLGFDAKREKSVTRPLAGHFKKAKTKPMRMIKEMALDKDEQIQPGQEFFVDMFKKGDYVDVAGVSIGKGFQGGVKRWNWRGGKASHGSMTHRRPGSIGASAFPSRVLKGHHLPGHMGNVLVTQQNLEVVEVDKDNNLLLVKGAVPGATGNYLVIKKSIKGKKKPVVRAEVKPAQERQQKEKPSKQKQEAKK